MGWLLLIIAAWWSDGEGWKRRRSETLRSQPGGPQQDGGKHLITSGSGNRVRCQRLQQPSA